MLVFSTVKCLHDAIRSGDTVYRETGFKKFYAGPLTPSIHELTFLSASIPAIPPEAVAALAAINRHTPISIAEVDFGGEWFRLESADLHHQELFNRLRSNWTPLCGRNGLSFALIYCAGGPDCGVWLHHLATWEKKAEYLHGCHQIPSWF
jgi:hypothetical protein